MRHLYSFMFSPDHEGRLHSPVMRWAAAAVLHQLQQGLAASTGPEAVAGSAGISAVEAGRWATAFCELSGGDPLFAAAVSLLLCRALGDAVQVRVVCCSWLQQQKWTDCG